MYLIDLFSLIEYIVISIDDLRHRPILTEYQSTEGGDVETSWEVLVMNDLLYATFFPGNRLRSPSTLLCGQGLDERFIWQKKLLNNCYDEVLGARRCTSTKSRCQYPMSLSLTHPPLDWRKGRSMLLGWGTAMSSRMRLSLTYRGVLYGVQLTAGGNWTLVALNWKDDLVTTTKCSVCGVPPVRLKWFVAVPTGLSLWSDSKEVTPKPRSPYSFRSREFQIHASAFPDHGRSSISQMDEF